MKIVCIKDMTAGLFLNPMSYRSTPEALRNFEVVANEGDSMIRKFPQEFRLFELGTFNSETGQITVHAEPIDLGCAGDFVHNPGEGGGIRPADRDRSHIKPQREAAAAAAAQAGLRPSSTQ